MRRFIISIATFIILIALAIPVGSYFLKQHIQNKIEYALQRMESKGYSVKHSGIEIDGFIDFHVQIKNIKILKTQTRDNIAVNHVWTCSKATLDASLFYPIKQAFTCETPTYKTIVNNIVTTDVSLKEIKGTADFTLSGSFDDAEFEGLYLSHKSYGATRLQTRQVFGKLTYHKENEGTDKNLLDISMSFRNSNVSSEWKFPDQAVQFLRIEASFNKACPISLSKEDLQDWAKQGGNCTLHHATFHSDKVNASAHGNFHFGASGKLNGRLSTTFKQPAYTLMQLTKSKYLPPESVAILHLIGKVTEKIPSMTIPVKVKEGHSSIVKVPVKLPFDISIT